ncbi:MAG: hypothetical protein ACE5HU_08270, partial [Acidobacteriota bacterium]
MRQRPRRRRGVSDSRVSVPIRYGSLSSPIGRIWLAFTDRGLRRVALGGPTEQEFLVDLLRLEPAGRPVRDERAAEIAAARAELREYFAGRRRHFSLRVDRRRL